MSTTSPREDAPAGAQLITAVAPGSPAAGARIAAGDCLLAIAGAPVRDYLDYRFLSAEERVTVEIRRPNGKRRAVVIRKHPDADLGLGFPTDLFDGMRRCRNRCLFCFYDQLPAGLRPSLYTRDDDYRLSFMHGNFVTLTNLAPEEFARIAEQRLSPLYVSVHATDPDLRRRLLGNPRAPDLLRQLRRLARARIRMHAQIVLCPGLNDGAALDRSVADLAALHPAVASIAIVPVGLTRHRRGLFPLRAVGRRGARAVLRRVERWQADFRERLDTRLVFAADEVYLQAGEPFPPAADYEDFPQRDNGVGLGRLFLEELARTDFRRAAGRAVTLVTGRAAGDLVGAMAARMREQGVAADVIVVANRLLGRGVTVAGLLTGADIAHALAGAETAGIVALPAAALRDDAFLDSMTVKELAHGLGKKVVRAEGPRALAMKLARLRPAPAPEGSN